MGCRIIELSMFVKSYFFFLFSCLNTSSFEDSPTLPELSLFCKINKVGVDWIDFCIFKMM